MRCGTRPGRRRRPRCHGSSRRCRCRGCRGGTWARGSGGELLVPVADTDSSVVAAHYEEAGGKFSPCVVAHGMQERSSGCPRVTSGVVDLQQAIGGREEATRHVEEAAIGEAFGIAGAIRQVRNTSVADGVRAGVILLSDGFIRERAILEL